MAKVFAIQDDITESVVGKIAGVHGIISKAATREVLHKSPGQLESYDCVLRSYELYRVLTREAHLVARDCLERAVGSDPGYAEIWAHLAQVYGLERELGLDPRPDPLARALTAALRAVRLDPASQMALYNLAYVRYQLQQVDEFVDAAERAVALNPNNTEVLGTMGLFFYFSGRYERGLALSRKAVALDPDPPGHHYFGFVWEHYRRGEYEQAVEWVRKVNMPDFYWTQIALAASYGQLGRQREASASVRRLRALRPDFAPREHVGVQFFPGSELFEKTLEGLRRAGMDVPSG